MNNRKVGAYYEEKAEAYLRERGISILERNFRCRCGEIDLIARDGESFVFVEVKYRNGEACGGPLQAVDIRKQKRIGRAAVYYLYTRVHSVDVPCRFDVIGFEGEQIFWLKNAFDYT